MMPVCKKSMETWVKWTVENKNEAKKLLIAILNDISLLEMNPSNP